MKTGQKHNFRALAVRGAAAGGLVLASGSALATSAYDGLTGAAVWSDVTTAVPLIGVAIAGVLVVVRGTRILLGMIRR